MNRFVVLSHRMPASMKRGDHIDLMLEHEGQLRTWALDSWPPANEPLDALQLEDHRLHYLDYEGPISNDRGDVSRVTAGTYEVRVESPDRLELRLISTEGTIECRLERQSNQRWMLTPA